jgi:NADH:ubiquinone oxidoreductase subunit 4 (subunit M)
MRVARRVRRGAFSVYGALPNLPIYTQVGSTDYETLLTFSFSRLEQKILWFSFFIAFASKVPMLPLHL